MASKEKEAKLVLEREYIVPLRKDWIKVPYYRRVKRTVNTLREFVAKHMKIGDRDVDKVKLDKWLNHELNFRNEKAMNKIKVRCKKYDDGIVRVELAEIPAAIKHRAERERKILTEGEKRAEEKRKEQEKLEEQEKKKAEAEGKARSSGELGPEQTPEEIEAEKKAEEEKKKSEEIANEMRDKEQKKESKHGAMYPRDQHQVRTAPQNSDKN